MSSIKEDLSPKNVYKHVKKTLENHFFLSPNTGKECKFFLKLLQSTEECLNEQERNDIYNKLSQLTIKLWGMMLKDALDALDEADCFIHKDTIRGISRLKSYLKGFKEFEILLYGSDKWYRDTIYHQLWFYFVGEYLFSKYHIMEVLLERKKDWYCVPINKSRKKILNARYACFCVIALCHDLGKPLEKISSLNDAIRKMLKNYQFLQFNPFKVEFPLTYGQMLKFLVNRLSQFGIPYRDNEGKLQIEEIEKLCKESKKNKEKEIYYIKMECYLDNKQHLQATYSSALAELNHGLLSCLLLMESFFRFKGGSAYENWKEEFKDIEKDMKEGKEIMKKIWVQKSYLTSQSILKSIAIHSLKQTVITEIELPYFWVCLVDDLTEWYRPTRAGKDFISSGLCKVRIDEVSLNKVHVCYVFNNNIAKNKEEIIGDDAIHFFIDKIEKYYNLLDIQLEFTIDVKNNGYLMRFYYKKNDKEEKVRRFSLKSNKNGPLKDYDNEKIEELLMKDLGDKIEFIRVLISHLKNIPEEIKPYN